MREKLTLEREEPTKAGECIASVGDHPCPEKSFQKSVVGSRRRQISVQASRVKAVMVAAVRS